MSKKRALPGDNDVKVPELSAHVLALVDSLEKEQERFVMADEFASMYKIIPFYEKRREKLKSIPNFWTTVLQNDSMFITVYGNHPEDFEAIKYLEDVWVARHRPDPRAYTLELVSTRICISLFSS
jgi:template-activating factor I